MSDQLRPGAILPGLTAGSRVAGYLLEEQVGVGGMAVVFRAVDERLARRVALKVDVQPGRPDHVYLSDFGLSKGAVSAVGLTGAGQFLGTPNYMAPEQIEGRPVDGRADQYAPARLALAAIAAVVLVAGAILAAVLLSSPGRSNAGPPSPLRTSSPRPARTPSRTRARAPATEFTVCVDPVVSCGLAQMQTRPTTVLLSGDGSGLMQSVHWSGWGAAVATGSGTYELDTCVPSCAQGKYHPSPATITLTALTPYAGGKRAYADMVVSAPDAARTARFRHLVP